MNDSAYPLNVQVLDRAGRHLAYIHLDAGQLFIYDASQGAFDKNINATYTPFTVIFLCDSGRPYDYSQPQKHKKGQKVHKSEYINQFGVWTDVPRGSTVNAMGCPAGSKSCVVRKNNKVKGKRSSEFRTTAGSNNWSNDGGQTWTNDASSGSSCSDWGGCVLKGSRMQESRADARPWLNKNEKNFQDEQGQTWQNDGKEEFSNDDNKPFENDKNSKPPTSSFREKGQKKPHATDSKPFSNDGPEEWTNDASTPMPFKESQ